MRKTIGWIALINLLLSPVIFTWQLIYKLCDNAQVRYIALKFINFVI